MYLLSFFVIIIHIIRNFAKLDVTKDGFFFVYDKKKFNSNRK